MRIQSAAVDPPTVLTALIKPRRSALMLSMRWAVLHTLSVARADQSEVWSGEGYRRHGYTCDQHHFARHGQGFVEGSHRMHSSSQATSGNYLQCLTISVNTSSAVTVIVGRRTHLLLQLGKLSNSQGSARICERLALLCRHTSWMVGSISLSGGSTQCGNGSAAS